MPLLGCQVRLPDCPSELACGNQSPYCRAWGGEDSSVTRDIEQLETSALLDGRYQLHERVGIGGMAEVFRAEDVLLGRTVAIKLMRADADVLAAPVRAQREVSALATVTDPSLVTLLEAKIGPDAPRYLVMEFVDGPTLAQRLHEGPLP